jgi:hypothetical protein
MRRRYFLSDEEPILVEIAPRFATKESVISELMTAPSVNEPQDRLPSALDRAIISWIDNNVGRSKRSDEGDSEERRKGREPSKKTRKRPSRTVKSTKLAREDRDSDTNSSSSLSAAFSHLTTSEHLPLRLPPAQSAIVSAPLIAEGE